MKRIDLILAFFIIVFLLPSLACKAVNRSSSSTGDTVFSGRAFADVNGNRQLDSGDTPLASAQFKVAGYSEKTDSTGIAVIVIPGGSKKAMKAQMDPPANSPYTLIGPAKVTLQEGKQTNADFLFSVPASLLITPTPRATPPPGQAQAGSIERDLTYCTTQAGLDLKMDVYYPDLLNGPTPVVVYVHGGAWRSGDKSEGTGLSFRSRLREAGFIFVSIDYRLSPEYQFPAHIQDVQCAIRHLRANASRYLIDPDKIGAMGTSAGGHLVSLLGAADQNAVWGAGEYSEPFASQSARVQAVVDMFGPTDLEQMAFNAGENTAEMVFGTSGPTTPVLKIYSPTTYVTPDDPPFLILQGLEDRTVPPSQSQILYDLLDKTGVPAQLVMVKNAGHNFRPVNGAIDPSMAELETIVVNFFKQYLNF